MGILKKHKERSGKTHTAHSLWPFGSREPLEIEIPSIEPKQKNADGYYKMTCPYCLEEFDVWEMPFRAKSQSGAGAASDNPSDKETPGTGSRTSGRGGHKKGGGYQAEDTLNKPAVSTATAPAATGNLDYLPPEEDAKYARFAKRVNRSVNATVLGKVLTLFQPDADGGAFDGKEIKEVRLRGSQEWIRVDSSTAKTRLYHQAIVRVKDSCGNETETKLCPHCHNAMSNDACLIPNYTIMFLGNTNSGKTVYKIRLLYELSNKGLLNRSRGMSRIVTGDTIDGISATSVDDLYNKTFGTAYEGEASIAPMTQIRFIDPITFPLLQGNKAVALLTFYDFPGEAIWKRKDDAEYQWFLAQVERRMNELDGMIFLLDTSSVKFIRSALPKDHLVVAKKAQAKDAAEADPAKRAAAEQAAAERAANAAKTPSQVLSQFQNNFITAEMENQISIPVCYVFSKADLLEKVIREFRENPETAPGLRATVDNLMDPPVCVTNWCEQGLAKLLKDQQRGGSFNPSGWEGTRTKYIESRQKQHNDVDMENILRSDEELSALMSNEMGMIMEVSPKGLLFAVSAVGVPVVENQPIQEADPLRLTEPLEYLLWQMGLVECDESNLADADRERLAKLRTDSRN